MYTGSAQVGGPTHVRDLTHLTIKKLAVGPLANNVYLLRCRNTGVQILIDAADQPQDILTMIGPDPLSHILTTHSHPDHWQALSHIAGTTGALTCAPAADVADIAPTTAIELNHGTVITFGRCEVEVITVGGHTKGCSMFVYRDPKGHEHLFSGDALFPGGLGKTGTTEDFTTLFKAVKTQAFDRLSDSTWVYPGHGDDTTLGRERPQLDEWQARGW